MEIIDTLQVIAIILVSLLYFFVFYFVFIKRERVKRIRSYFFKGLVNIFSSNESTSSYVEEFDLVYKKLKEKFPRETNQYRNAIEILEDIFTQINVQDINRICKVYKLKEDSEKIIDKQKLLDMIKLIKEKRPFSSINSKESHLLMNIKTAIETNNVELGNTMLTQLSDNIEIVENNLRNQERQSKKSFVVAIVGIVLTVIFGLSQLIPFISTLIN
ncbi:hypothetical protein [Marinifilum fragile]|uniref:hypothetical protein n=1 Tax=Marinifilum fragile TaxID=570161 RepID=UPI002AA72871|nr:hypothetical protein [Marinifilum fragile]